MDEQQTLTAEQIIETAKPYFIAWLKQESAFFQEGGQPQHTMRWTYATINRMSLDGARKALGQQ